MEDLEPKSFFEEHSKPLVISVITALITFAATWGSVQSKVADLQRASELMRSEYVTRVEFNQLTTSINVRLDDMKLLLLELRAADRRNSDRQDNRDAREFQNRKN